jgi:hypothetical protein
MQFEALAAAGGIVWGDPGRLSSYLGRLDGQRLVVTVEPVLPRRSLAQNRMIWGGVYTPALKRFSALSGHTTKELHEILKRRFLSPVPLYGPGGEVIGDTYSTKRLTVPEASEYIERCFALFASMGMES